MSSAVVCGPLPIVGVLGVFVPPKGSKTPDTQLYIAQDTKAWLSHSNISYSFPKPDPNAKIHDWQVQLVEEAIAEYTRYVNVNLIRAEEGKEESADIRISFDGQLGAWSAIGTDALKISTGSTMNLGFLSGFSENGPTKSGELKRLLDLTLHQFGHAFGLAHEWDKNTRLNADHDPAIAQHMTVFKDQDTSNFPEVDKDSIMMFPAPGAAGGLSKKDKAWLTLMYPGKAGGADPDTGILSSLKDLEVPLGPSSQILLSASVSEMRFHYHECILDKWKDKLTTHYVNDATKNITQAQLNDLQPAPHVLKGKVSGITPLIDHNGEDDLYDAVAAAILDPQFSQVLANVVNEDNDGKKNVQNVIFNPSIRGTRPWEPIVPHMAFGINSQAPPDVQHIFGPIIGIIGDIFGKLFLSGLPAGGAPGAYPQALPPNVQQSIFGALGKFLTHPTFLNIVKDVVQDVVAQHNIDARQKQQPPTRRP